MEHLKNLASILQVISDPHVTKRVWMVETTYFLGCTIFQDAGSDRLRGVPENEHGIDIEFLRTELSKFKADTKPDVKSMELKPSSQYNKVFRHLLYLTPTFSNPSARQCQLRSGRSSSRSQESSMFWSSQTRCTISCAGKPKNPLLRVQNLPQFHLEWLISIAFPVRLGLGGTVSVMARSRESSLRG